MKGDKKIIGRKLFDLSLKATCRKIGAIQEEIQRLKVGSFNIQILWASRKVTLEGRIAPKVLGRGLLSAPSLASNSHIM